MPNSLAPGFITIDYHSAFGAHKMTLPTNAINVNESDPAASTIDTHDAGTVLWTDMVDALVAEAVDQFSASVTFDIATLYNQPTADDIPEPIATYSVGEVGTVGTPGWQQATQLTLIGRTLDVGIAKLVLLDFASGGAFTKTTVLSGSGLEALWGVLANVSYGFVGRDGTRPNTFIAATRTLNEKLRKSYNLS